MVDLPPLLGRSNDHGPQALLSMLIVAELRQRARELATEGSVELSAEALAALATRAAVPPHLIQPLLDRWTQDGDDGPAFLERLSPAHYALGKTHEAARQFLLDIGQREVQRSLDARRSAQARARSRKQKKGAG